MSVGVIASTGLPETSPELFATVTEASVPGHTCHSPPVPLGVGTVNVIAVSLQLSIWRVAVLPGAPQLVPLSENATYPDPWVAPKPEPVIVTCWPAAAVAGLTDAATGALGGWADAAIAKMCSWPWVAPDGRVTLVSVLPGSTGSAA